MCRLEDAAPSLGSAGDDVGRRWRRITSEEVYLHAYDSASEARASLGRYLDLCNRRRPHPSLDDRTPDRAHCGTDSLLPIRLAA
jgi:putative transposase